MLIEPIQHPPLEFSSFEMPSSREEFRTSFDSFRDGGSFEPGGWQHSVTFAFPLSSRTLERGDSRRRRRGGPLSRFRCQDRGLFKVQPLYIPVPQRNGRRYGRAPWP